jgi:hypothetical protein
MYIQATSANHNLTPGKYPNEYIQCTYKLYKTATCPNRNNYINKSYINMAKTCMYVSTKDRV